jgi:hypothetical protein
MRLLPKKWEPITRNTVPNPVMKPTIFLNAPLRCALAFGREEVIFFYAFPGLPPLGQALSPLCGWISGRASLHVLIRILAEKAQMIIFEQSHCRDQRI